MLKNETFLAQSVSAEARLNKKKKKLKKILTNYLCAIEKTDLMATTIVAGTNSAKTFFSNAGT